jgi:hypothetical protein
MIEQEGSNNGSVAAEISGGENATSTSVVRVE